MNSPVVTRFAPSPTGFLHIGGARTALFNWLFARHHGGTFLLRIEDTDRERSTQEATAAILDGMVWLGLDHDGEAISQFERAPRHREVAEAMLENGSAYRCYASKGEIDAHREANPNMPFQSPWRSANPASAPADTPYTIRLKAPQAGETLVEDKVQGVVTFKNETMDDLILLRSDGTPTYMLAVVVDDHDMGVTHIIRGDDHLVNAARQTLIFAAMGWDVPVFAHIPLIHGPDGKKLSKRHGALGVGEYREMGYLPEAMRNYLARLGWSHGDEEFFTTEQAIEWFGLDSIGKAASRFDFDKLEHINGLHMRAADDQRLAEIVAAQYNAHFGGPISDSQRASLMTAMPALKARAKNVQDLFELAYYVYASRPLAFDEKAAKQMNDETRELLAKLTSHLRNASSWAMESLEENLKAFAESEGLKFGKVAQPLRAALTGRGVSPGVYDVMIALGREETLARIDDQIS